MPSIGVRSSCGQRRSASPRGGWLRMNVRWGCLGGDGLGEVIVGRVGEWFDVATVVIRVLGSVAIAVGGTL